VETYAQLRDRMIAKYGRGDFGKLNVDQAMQVIENINQDIDNKEMAFVISPPNSEKLYVTGRVKAEHWDTPINRAFSYVTGRYVQAETANKNGAFWAAEDLSFGYPSVANGPVNLLHNDNCIIGTISEAHLHENDPKYGTHITTMNVLWKYLYPEAVVAVEKASEEGKLWQSMETVAEHVQCLGCEEKFDYGTYMRDKTKACEHIVNGGVRRLVNPTFLATGLILGSSRPAWSDADVELRRDSAKIAEDNHMAENNMSQEFAENLVGQVLAWANSSSK
jgi:hypothetical protein